MSRDAAREAVSRVIADEAGTNTYGIVECACCQAHLADRILAKLVEMGVIQQWCLPAIRDPEDAQAIIDAASKAMSAWEYEDAGSVGACSVLDCELAARNLVIISCPPPPELQLIVDRIPGTAGTPRTLL